MSYQIRAAKEIDAPYIYNFICLLEETRFEYPVFESIYKLNIINKDYHYLVAVSGAGTIIGFISCHTQNLLHHCGKVAEIQELFVDDRYRNLGVGGHLVRSLNEILLNTSCTSFEVTAQNKRIQTHAFYEWLGFACTHKKFVKQMV